MTVCTASVFSWVYDPATNDFGGAVVAASDRKLTDIGLGIGYEGARFKGALMSNSLLVLVSGDIVVHTAILTKLGENLNEPQAASALEMAEIVGQLMREYRMTEASRMYLAPLNLDENSFIAQQRTMESSLVIELANQLQQHKIEAEALVVGVDDNSASLFRIDAKGLVTNHSDIGFVSIGSGGIHSSAYFMTTSYTHATMYYRALYHTFAAKKRAEVDPYVGTYTDMFVLNRNMAAQIPREMIAELERIYAERIEHEKRVPEEAEMRLIEVDKNAQPSDPPNIVHDASRN
ncbi:MAG: hypothetical protein WBW31_02095 [Candidatus Sulfotelmatobacter sp.]